MPTQKRTRKKPVPRKMGKTRALEKSAATLRAQANRAEIKGDSASAKRKRAVANREAARAKKRRAGK